jgi:hypothetical protein
MPHLGDQNLLPMILFDASCEWGISGSDQGESVFGEKNAGLKAATLISVSNPVSQVLW